MKKALLLTGVLCLVLVGCKVDDEFVSHTTEFRDPHIKDDFCGVHINFMWCKCTFHNEFCDGINTTQDGAREHLYNEFEKWTEEQRDDFMANCIAQNGYMENEETCAICVEGAAPQDGWCVPLAK